jgi:hypothetical protein
MRLLQRALVLAGAIALGWIVLGPRARPDLPPKLIEGVYANPCCAPFEIRDGRIRAGRESASFTVESDKQGVYLLPDRFVGVVDRRHLVFDSAIPLKLRADNDAAPTAFELSSFGGGPSYRFTRR